MRVPRLSARGRLTVLYTALVLAAGIVMTALTYVLMRRSLRFRAYVTDDDASGAPADPPVPAKLEELLDQERTSTLSDLLVQATVALVVVSLLAAVLGWLVAGRVLRPIRSISVTARRLSAENLQERVPLRAPADELFELADTVNGMLDRIQAGVAERDRVLESQRMFTANAAHELRTPLTTMRTAIDVTLDGEPTRQELVAMVADIDNAVERGRRTLDGLLVLARSHNTTGDRRAMDLANVAALALESVSAETAHRRITVRDRLLLAPVSGEPTLLERLAGNLIDNALRYNKPGGHIAISTGTAGRRAFLRITNSGPTIAPEIADTLLEPFVRGDGERSSTAGGVGLGLSIVRAIVIAHRGELEVTANPGGGLAIVVELPLRGR